MGDIYKKLFSCDLILGSYFQESSFLKKSFKMKFMKNQLQGYIKSSFFCSGDTKAVPLYFH